MRCEWRENKKIKKKGKGRMCGERCEGRERSEKRDILSIQHGKKENLFFGGAPLW